MTDSKKMVILPMRCFLFIAAFSFCSIITYQDLTEILHWQTLPAAVVNIVTISVLWFVCKRGNTTYRYAPTDNDDCRGRCLLGIWSKQLPVKMGRSLVFKSIGNAARFAEEELTISLVRKGNVLILTVEDDGPGYPAALLQNGPRPFAKMSGDAAHFGMGLYSGIYPVGWCKQLPRFFQFTLQQG
mgnify:CR=1 FL=1